MTVVTENTRIQSVLPVSTPAQVKAELPISARAAETTLQARKAIQDILSGQDDRLLVVVGPCSIHDTAAALDYAGRLAGLRERLSRDLLIVMRVYFEKPRTTVGWKGLINDPDLDDSFGQFGTRLSERILQARRMRRSLRGNQAVLRQMTPQRRDCLRSLPHEQIACLERQARGLLRYALHRHEPHGRARCRLRDGLGIGDQLFKCVPLF